MQFLPQPCLSDDGYPTDMFSKRFSEKQAFEATRGVPLWCERCHRLMIEKEQNNPTNPTAVTSATLVSFSHARSRNFL